MTNILTSGQDYVTLVRAGQKRPFFGVLMSAKACFIIVVQNLKKSEVRLVRVKITLACTECKQRNYNLTKEKKNHPERMETKKYCPFCKAHTMHKETK